MGCGASNDISRVQTPSLNKKSVLPAIDTKKKSHSAKSNGSNDSGIEDSEPIKCEQTTCFFCFFDSSNLGYF